MTAAGFARTMERMDVCIGSAPTERVGIVIHCADDPDGWLDCEIEVAAGGFNGRFRAFLRTADFPPFRKQLQHLYKRLEGVASFTTLEGQLALRLTGDGKGHISVEGSAVDVAGTGNRLIFEFEIDQTYLSRVIAELERVERGFRAESGT